MHIPDDLPERLHDLDRRVNQFEAAQSSAARVLREELNSFRPEMGRIASEHGALSRRVGAIERDSVGTQNAEIEALGRRIGTLEAAPSLKPDLLALSVLCDEQRAALAVERGRMDAQVEAYEGLRGRQAAQATALWESAAAIETGRGQQTSLDARIAFWEAWHARQTVWNAQRFWKRWWRRLRGERP